MNDLGDLMVIVAGLCAAFAFIGWVGAKSGIDDGGLAGRDDE